MIKLIEMLVSLSADHNLDDFDWYTFTGDKATTLKGFNQRHDFRLEKGDVYGVRSSRLLGKYQAVKAGMTHVLFRNIPEDKIDKLVDKSKAYRGSSVKHPELEGRKRASKVAIKTTEIKIANRLTDVYFTPKNVTERSSYDRQNYQWRKLGKQVRIITKKMGKARKPLEHGDTVGLRFVTNAKGGYVIMPNDERVNIPTEVYKEIVENSRILPRNEQQIGVVDMYDIKDKILADRPQRTVKRATRRGDSMVNLRRRLASDPILGGDDDDDFEEETNHEAELLRDMLSPGSILRISRTRDRVVLVYRMKVDEKRRSMEFYFLGMSKDGKPNVEDVYYTKLDSGVRVSDVKSKLSVEGHYPTRDLKKITGVELSDAQSLTLR